MAMRVWLLDHFVGVFDVAVRVNTFAVFFALVFPVVVFGSLALLRPANVSAHAQRDRRLVGPLSLAGGLLLTALALSAVLPPGTQLVGALLARPYFMAQRAAEAWKKADEESDMRARAATLAETAFGQMVRAATFPFVPLAEADLRLLEVDGGSSACDVRLWHAPLGSSWAKPLVAWRMVPEPGSTLWLVRTLARHPDGRRVKAAAPPNTLHNDDPIRVGIEPVRGAERPNGLMSLIQDQAAESVSVYNRNPRAERIYASARAGVLFVMMPSSPDDMPPPAPPPAPPRIFRMTVTLVGARPELADQLTGESFAMSLRADGTLWVKKFDGASMQRLRARNAEDIDRVRSVAQQDGRVDPRLVKVVGLDGLDLTLEVSDKLPDQPKPAPASPIVSFIIRPVDRAQPMAGGGFERSVLTRYDNAPSMQLGARCRGDVPTEMQRRVAELD